MKNILFRPRIIIVLFIFISIHFSGKSFANPLPDPYSYPLIAEAQIVDSLKWSIELDRTYLDPQYSGKTYCTVAPGSPCTTTKLKLRFSSHPTVYSTSITFDAAGIAVLTRDGITGLLPNEIAPVNVSHDTIKIIDTITPYGERGWRLPINSYYPTKSLIATSSYGSYIWNINPNIGIKNSTFFGIANQTMVQSYEKPFIDEVYATDSLNWKIELDADIYNTILFNYSNDTAIHYPTASERFMLRFSSNPETFSTRISFDSTGIGVMSRNSITGVPSTQKIPLKAGRDTIVLIDERIGACERAFRLPIDTIVNGHSLNYSDCQPNMFPPAVMVRLEKPTIGRRNGTVYKLNLIDSLNVPITNTDLYAYSYEYYPTITGMTNNKNGRMTVTLSLCKDADTLLFAEISPDNLMYIPRQDTRWIDSCVISYVDTADTITKTIQLIKKYTTSVKKDPLPKNAPTAANLMVIPLSNREMTFVVTVNKDVKNVSLQTFTASGQLISTVKIMNDNKKGTFTIPGRSVFSKAAHVTKGVCYCTIIADGKQCAAKTVIVP